MTFELNTNRLNLPGMVHRQIKENPQPQNAETYFNPLFITGKRKGIEDKEPRHAEMSTSFNSIVASVHSKLRSTQQVYQKARKLEEPKSLVEEEPKEESEFTASKNSAEKEKLDLGDGGKIKIEAKNINTQKTSPATVLPSKAISIPQIKANRANKQLQRMRRNIPKYSYPNNGDRAAYQKRIIEVREQKKILEDMLTQHQRLQRDRQSIAMEIHSMREHLSDIRKKLDASFRRLTTKPIAYSEMLLKPKVFIRPQQSQWPRSPTSSAKLPTLHSILKVSNGGKSSSSASTKSKAINEKTKSANNSPVRHKKDTTKRTASLPRNTNGRTTNSAKTYAN